MANCKLCGQPVTAGVVMHADCLERQMKEMTKILHGQQKNDPLTWDELREMDGEPVWIVGVSSINHFRGNWDICDWENGEVISFPYCVDSAQGDNDMSSLKNLFNEWMVSDTSKKIKAVFRSKGMSGKPLTSQPLYGLSKAKTAHL